MVRLTHHALPDHPVTTLDRYVALGGMGGLSRARSRPPIETIDEIATAGIRGRGGAGFPTGTKWRSLFEAATVADRASVVVNAAEGEPGTFKDRALLRSNAYVVLEGALVGAHCLGADRVIVATKSTYRNEVAALRRAIGELDSAGWLDGVQVIVVEGPDHYLFGEETGLLEVIEGEDPLPRHLPPYHYGLFTTAPQLGWSAGIDDSPGGPAEPSSNPALVNNVETFAHTALVCRNGSEWYRSMGTAQSPGPTIVTVTGDVVRPTVAEVELGQPLDDLIHELAGGPLPDRTIKAVLSGVSNPVLLADRLSTPVSYEHLASAGGGLGSVGFIVYDDRRNLIDVAYQVSRFLAVESCGQCNPCKTGSLDITTALEHLVAGTGSAGSSATIIERRLQTVTDASRCYLATQEQRVVASLLQGDSADLAERLEGVPGDLDVPLPKIIDLVDGTVEVDHRHRHKRPDWTYSETPVRFVER